MAYRDPITYIQKLLILGKPKCGKTTAIEALIHLVKKGTTDQFLGELIALEPGDAAIGGNIEGPHYDDKFSIIQKRNWFDAFIAKRLKAKVEGEYIPKIGIIDSTTELEAIAEAKGTTNATISGNWNTWTKKDVEANIKWDRVEANGTVTKVPAVAGVMKPTHLHSSVLNAEYGAGQNYLRDATRDYVNVLKTIYDVVIFIGHISDKLILEDKTAVSHDYINLTGKNKALFMSYMDASCIMNRTSKEGVLAFRRQLPTETSTLSRFAYLDNKVIAITTRDEATEKITWHWDKIFPFMDDYVPHKQWKGGM